MALRNIVVEGDEILRKRSKEVTEINEKIHMILDDMIDTMREYDGVGIAAPQVGILKRMFIVEIDGNLIEIINPEIIETRGIQKEDEGCLSVPGMVGTVERPEYIKVKGLNRNGEEIICEGTELMAVALSHEYDHLDGILYKDKAENFRELEAQ